MRVVYEIIPLKGVGPVLFGMSREEVHSVMGMPIRSYKKTSDACTLTDVYHEGCFQVFYDKEGKVEYIELSLTGDLFIAVYKGKDVFRVKAEELVEFVSRDAPFDPDAPEIGYAYVFPKIEMSLWRPVLPLNESDPEGQHFSTIGIGKRGYYSRERS